MGKVSGLLMTGLLVSMVWLGITGLIGDIGRQYGKDDLSATLEKIAIHSEIGVEINTTETALEEGQVSSTAADTPWEATMQAGRLLLGAPDIFNSMLVEIYSFSELQFGYYIIIIITSIMGLIVAFSVYKSWIGRSI